MDNRIHIFKGDITQMKVDAIVNAANTSLLGGGGVDGAIHRAGGPAILEECRRIRNRQGGCPVGEAVITTGGNLPARYVIHTVGPVWNGGGHHEEELLAAAYRKSLQLAIAHQLTSIAFPNISTGIYHFPKEKAAAIAWRTVSEFLAGNESLREVTFVCFDEENYDIYTSLFT
jgi:O-acetyl-ADP-ribose deacetylase (regulator of RNase III)